MKSVNPYLNFPGTTEQVFNFYKTVFGGEFAMLQRYKDTPEGDKVPEDVKDKIMHIALPIAPNCMLMATDAPESMGFFVTPGNNFYLAITPESKEEADRLFQALAAGGKVEMEMQDTFWGAYYGSLTDQFGIKWMINYQH